MANKLIEDERRVGFLDLDSDLRDVKPDKVVFSIGFELFIKDNSATIVNGNTVVPVHLPTGDNTCIGFGEDIEKLKGAYFIWNSLRNHSIYLYTLATNAIQLVLQSPILNFQKDYKIRNAEIIGDLLYWTDGYDGTNISQDKFKDTDLNSPRMINIKTAMSGGYGTLTLQDIQEIKYPPLKEPKAIPN